MSVDENIQVATDFVNAGNERDLDRGEALFANPEMGKKWRDMMVNYWFLAFPDIVWEPERITAQDNRVVIEAVETGTHLGELKWWVKEPVPPTNKKIRFLSCSIVTCEHGKITGLSAHYSVMHILGQLGITENIDWPPPIES